MPKAETSTEPIVRDAFEHKKQVFVPYLYKIQSKDEEKPGSIMDMVALHSISDWEALTRDSWGIPTVAKNSIAERQRVLGDNEPHENESQDKVEHSSIIGKLDMIVMPGVAFDRGLARLGHGKGFYDYFLQRYHSAKGAPMPFLGR